jgi:hypothetical protein
MMLPGTLVHRQLPLYKFPCSTRSLISGVCRYLSHDWIDVSQVTSKAAKFDYAATAIEMWNKRLILLFPGCTAKSLVVLRTWLLCLVRRNVLKGLRLYLAQEFGTKWHELLVVCRRLRVQHQCLSAFRDAVNSYLRQQGGIGLTCNSDPTRLVDESHRGTLVVAHLTDFS